MSEYKAIYNNGFLKKVAVENGRGCGYKDKFVVQRGHHEDEDFCKVVLWNMVWAGSRELYSRKIKSQSCLSHIKVR